MSNPLNEHVKPVRSFVRRTGRITKSQALSFQDHWSTYGLHSEPSFNIDNAFTQKAPLVIEVGFGMGDSLITMAKDRPWENFIGIEVHTPGVGRLLQQAALHQLTNIKVFQDDAVDILNTCIKDHSVHRLQIYFPDPWPKKKHHKRRLIQAPFVEVITQKLQTNGLLHLATDWEPYAHHMLDVLQATSNLINTSKSADEPFIPRPEFRPITKFEKRGERFQHPIFDILFQKCP